MGYDVSLAKQTSDGITKAVDTHSKDASSTLLDEVNNDLRSVVSDPLSRRSINDQLVITGDIWRDIAASSHDLQMHWATAGGTTEALGPIANGTSPDGTPVTGLESIQAQAIIDLGKTGLFNGSQLTPFYAPEEINRLKLANTASEVVGLGQETFTELAGDNKLDINEVNAALVKGGLTPQVQKALQDLQQDMGQLQDNNPFDFMSSPQVTWEVLQDKTSGDGEYGQEIAAIKSLQTDALLRQQEAFQTADAVTAPPGPKDGSSWWQQAWDRISQDSKIDNNKADGDITKNDAAPQPPSDATVAPELPPSNGADQPVPTMDWPVEKGDGFDRIAKKLLISTGMEKPSAQDIYYLSNLIAKLNNNDRQYRGGMLVFGKDKTLKVPDLTQLNAEDLIQQLRTTANS
jgi:hypothetical protein